MEENKRMINWNEIYQAMMTGISYMVPVIVAGGIIMAIPNLWTNGGASAAEEGLAHIIYNWGNTLFNMMYYVLAMFTAFAIAGRPALLSGLVVGIIAVGGNSGFFGAVVGGIIAGYVTRATIKYLKLPTVLGSAKAILFIPLITAIIMFTLMQFAIGPLCSWLMGLIYNFGKFVESIGYKPLLLAIFGISVCFGMGGPICVAMVPLMLAYVTNGDGQVAAAMNITSTSSCLGTAMAVMLFKKKFTSSQRANIPGLITGWICQITEFQIPFFLSDIKAFTLTYVISGAVGGFLVGILGSSTPTFHGGLFTALMAHNLPMHLLAMLGQAAVTVLCIFIFKKNISEDASEEEGIKGGLSF